MAQLVLMKNSNSSLIPATPDTSDFLHHKLKLGAILESDFKQVRNPKFHRKYFSLLNLGFEYWTPTGGLTSTHDRELLHGYSLYLVKISCCADSSIFTDPIDDFLNSIYVKQAEGVTLLKSFEAFRRWTIIQAGYFTEHIMPDGSCVKEPLSISFAKMDDTKFAELYKSTLNVLWNFILFKTFTHPHEAEHVANQLLSYA